MVGFVQHKDLQIRQVDKALPDQVVQSARAGHKDVHALFQGLHLRGLAHTAKDHGAAQVQVLAVGVKALADLQGKLPGGGQDQRADGPLAAGRVGSEAIQHGQRKGGRLAGAGLGTAHQIPAGQHRRDGRCLNGRRGLIACLLHSAQKRGGQIQFFKCHGSPMIRFHRSFYPGTLSGSHTFTSSPRGSFFAERWGSGIARKLPLRGSWQNRQVLTERVYSVIFRHSI